MLTSEVFWAAGILAGLVVVAALVNWLHPAHRPRLRRVITLFVLYGVVLGAAYAFRAGDNATWANGLFIAAQLLRAFSLVTLAALLVFSVLLPVLGANLPMIVGDLVVGFGYIVTTLIILQHHGLNPTSAVVSGAVVSAVLAISLQSTLGNILGGIALQLDGSIHEGDWIQLENGKQGKVRAVRWRHTIVETRDWSTIIVPNSQLLANNIIILGKRDGASAPQRMWVWFNVDFRFAPTQVIQVVTDAILDQPIENVAADPPPNCVCMDFTHDGRESVASYAVRYWLVDLAPDDPTNSRVRARIFTALARAGIPLAVPAHTAFVELKDEQRTHKRNDRLLEESLRALSTVHLFTAFTPDELRTLAAGMSHMIYTRGERITRQGAVAHWLYVMTKGTADIRIMKPEGEHAIVASLKAPDLFGEMGLMTGEPRTADVVATSDVECFRLGKDTFQQVLLARPAIVDELSHKLASRRVELMAIREGLDEASKKSREASERDRILGGIKQFFGL